MGLEEIGHLANIAKGYAIFVGVVFAMVVVWKWWRLYCERMLFEREIRAQNVFSSFLRVAAEQSDFASGDIPQNATESDDTRYAYFVSLLLSSAEEILRLSGSSRWRLVLKEELARHKAYFATQNFSSVGRNCCGPRLRELIDEAVA